MTRCIQVDCSVLERFGQLFCQRDDPSFLSFGVLGPKPNHARFEVYPAPRQLEDLPLPHASTEPVSAFLVPQTFLGKIRPITTPSHLNYQYIRTEAAIK